MRLRWKTHTFRSVFTLLNQSKSHTLERSSQWRNSAKTESCHISVDRRKRWLFKTLTSFKTVRLFFSACAEDDSASFWSHLRFHCFSLYGRRCYENYSVTAMRCRCRCFERASTWTWPKISLKLLAFQGSTCRIREKLKRQKKGKNNDYN